MNKVTFVVSDESINYMGSIVLTSGIDTTKFERNPVMFYMHERPTVIGRWENIRKDDDKLLADAVFDDTTPLGKQVKDQVEKGFLRAASIGIEIIEEKYIDGVNTITESILSEISIVDLPGNKNALKLYKKGNRSFIRLAEKVTDLRASIIEVLGLDDNVTDSEILADIRALKNAPDDETIQVEEAIKNGFIESNSRQDFITMARISPKAFNSFLNSEAQKRKRNISVVIDEAIKTKPIGLEGKKCLLERVGEKCGIDTLAELLSMIPRQRKISDVIRKNYEGWTLADFRQYAPEVLKNNPKLYSALLAKESETANGTNSLEYYRKNNPEYLKENPEFYNKLLTQQNNI